MRVRAGVRARAGIAGRGQLRGDSAFAAHPSVPGTRFARGESLGRRGGVTASGPWWRLRGGVFPNVGAGCAALLLGECIN